MHIERVWFHCLNTEKIDNIFEYNMVKHWWLCLTVYICASALYLMPVMSQYHLVIIDQVISAHRHVKEVVDGINAVDKRYIYKLMSNV